MEFRSAPTHRSLDLSHEQHRRIINGTSGHDPTNPNGNDTQTLDHHLHHRNNNHLQQLQRLNLDHHDLNQNNQNQLTSISVTGGGAEISPISVRYDAKTPSPSSRSSVRYRECLKNHAANIGGNVTDGCGEFMPSGESGTIEALTCAACNCHRNFHLKFVDGETQFRRNNSISNSNNNNAVVVHPLHLPPPPRQIQHHKFNPGHHHHLNTINAPPVAAVAYVSGGTSTGTGGTESSSEELNNNNSMFNRSNTGGGEITQHHPPSADHQHRHPYSSVSKKRFRTRFTQEQKQRMLEFAEKVGWRIQKQYEGELEKLCDEVGVKRQVLKVWMHNNKNHSMKKQLDQEQQQAS